MIKVEDLFHDLTGKTEDMLRTLESSKQFDIQVIDHLFAERESILAELRKILQDISDISIYQSLYDKWQEREMKLRNLIEAALKDLEKKITESQNARTVSKQYDSYLRQMPYGAFLDKKR
ncbi:hypothetical protein O9H85_21180 [Paenibacillus filicis]|uniref:Flagellar protein FliT n=1 Tax=Paenibacillus gyeongsangnamensis TaxID=3388067 RepID=A0ABT4QDD0_9BACL|nr:hypothetical protein [Paenibacillus filicis]MCZ8514887.1 hypothetical protein [Paenibacillus filicis]